MSEVLILQLLLIVLDTIEKTSKPKYTPEQRRVIREARRLAVQEAEDTE